jgi:polo-like kinase 1
MAAVSSPPLPPVPDVLHRTSRTEGKVSYIIGEQLGSGGFATVYAGKIQPGDLPVAIKCIPKFRLADPKIKDKLVSEVEIHRSLDHRNVVKFLGVFQDDNYVYILLELCHNGTVLDQLRRHTPFTEDETATYARQILEGLVYLHANRVIHRDLKLQNFLLSNAGTLKLGDFGLSAKLEDDDDKRMTVCGTPGYLSPEVLEHIDGQTYSVDIWATGVCTFLMLTGRQPFQSKDKRSTYKKIQQVCYSWPSHPILTSAAKNFVETALQRDPQNRPSALSLLSHPFILRQRVEMPIEVIPEEEHPPVNHQELTLPSWAVRIWWDYSHRYGLAYLLHNGVCGACFNDNSRILMTPDELITQYWETPQTPNPEVLPMRGIDESPIRKKLLLVKHFASELKQRAGTMKMPPLRINMPADVISHVKYWARTKDGVL